ncbi:MAG: ATP-dependent helicase HrpB, partial [Proteobacteria bacterium]|nr:ATP-dependent helicase HrpB [Pseudomonadota bacterium]
QQQQAISPPPSGQRKVVLATNIAETSLTIEGIGVVIDSGLQREIRFNPGSGMNSLQTTMISQSSATQRSGRAGRLSAGTCYRLWTESQHKRLPSHQSAEILTADLAPMMLELAQWGVQDVEELHWLDRPPAGTMAQAKSLLESLNAINKSGKITSHGKKILSLGIHPRLGHMILRGQAINLAETSCLLAALLSEKDIFRNTSRLNTNGDSLSSNIEERLSMLQHLQEHSQIEHTNTNNLVDKQQCRRVLQSAKEFFRRLPKIRRLTKNSNPNSIKNFNQSYNDMAGVLLAFAYPDRIAKLRNLGSTDKDRRYLLSNGKGAVFTNHPFCYESLANEPYLVIANLHQQSHKTDARIFTAAPISSEQLEEYFIDLIDEQDSLSWNHKLQKVESVFNRKLGSLILTEQPNPIIDITQCQPILFQGIKKLGLDCLPWSKQALQLKHRVQFILYQQMHNDLNKNQLNQIDIPDFSDDYLLDNLDHWLQPHLKKEMSIQQLQTLNLLQILNASINWQQMKQLNELAPEKIKVPSGTEIRIDYSDPEAPILAVRLQELFGLNQTPAIIRGSFPLLLHLLSPASRPMQVTQDLASFWENTYNDVKKELRGKYKKHYWPDDPLQAQATHRVKPRKVKCL